MRNKILSLFLAFALFSCGSSDEANIEKASVEPQNTNVKPQMLNISIVLDLSDRVIQPMQPSQAERDIQIVGKLTEIFKNNMKAKGSFQSKDKIRVLFKPAPNDPNINNIAKKLSVDLSNMNSKQKKEVYDNITTNFEEGLREIYTQTINTKNWVGSDVWRFFKNDVKDLCVESSPEYRNIVVIVTDGYLYHEQSRDRQQNKTSYITPKFLQDEGFRKDGNWREKMEKEDYGLLSTNQTIDNLEVMVLEINASDSHKKEEDIIKAYLNQWFRDMKIEDPVLHTTDLPSNTDKRIENFFRS